MIQKSVKCFHGIGSATEFKKKYSIPIQRSCEEGAREEDRSIGDSAAEELRKKLSLIMLRRTQDDILRHLLLPRKDIVVYLSMPPKQAAAYRRIVERIIPAIGGDVDCLVGISTDEVESEQGTLLAQEAVEASGDQIQILPLLTALRIACNSSEIGNLNPSTPFLYRETSVKLHVLESLVQWMRQLHPDEKVVVVSSFTSTLDLIAELARRKGWVPFYRLDGQVATERRQHMVDSFNRPGDPAFLFLLSCKAGGVGINL